MVTRLGKSGLKVNTVAVGTMRLGSSWRGFNGDIDECLKILKFCTQMVNLKSCWVYSSRNTIFHVNELSF